MLYLIIKYFPTNFNFKTYLSYLDIRLKIGSCFVILFYVIIYLIHLETLVLIIHFVIKLELHQILLQC